MAPTGFAQKRSESSESEQKQMLKDNLFHLYTLSLKSITVRMKCCAANSEI